MIRFNLPFPTTVVASLVAVLVTAIGTGTVLAQCTIDFEDQSDGTPIAIQYRFCGVVFSGDAGDPPPKIFDYGPDDIGKILHSYDWYSPMVLKFVDSGNLVDPDPVAYIEFDNPASDGDILHVEVFAVDGSLIGSHTSTIGSPETVTFNFGQPIAARMVVDDEFDTAFTVDNLTLADEPPIFRGRFESGETSRWSGTVGIPEK